MKEDWIEQQRQKLEGHRKTPPAGLWEGICEQMGLTPEPVRQSQTMRRWHWVAAAAVIALVGLFMVYQFQSEPEKSLSSINSEPSIRSTSSKGSKSSLNKEPSISQPPSLDTKTIVGSKLSTSSTPSVSSVRPLLLAEEKEAHSDADTSQQSHVDTDTLQQTESSPIPTNPVTHSYSHFEGNQTSYASTPTSQLDKWSLGVNASGGLLAANTSQRTNYFYENSKETAYASGLKTEYISEHHLPIRFGLSVNYQLTPLLALHSGISYTYLYSEFSISLEKNVNYDQKLHYLGIPVGVTWQLWSANRFRFYVSGGMMLEKCIGGERDGSSVSQKPWQWSFEAATGAEYTFTRQFSVYMEPSLGYYFNDGSSLEHYYKEHPWTPSLEFGLRLHFNK